MKMEPNQSAARWKPKACGFCVAQPCPVTASTCKHLNFPLPGCTGDYLFIPRELRCQDFSRYEVSGRLQHLLAAAGIERLGDLNGRQLSKLLRLRNWGRGACLEVLGLVRHLQHGNWHEHSAGTNASAEMEFEI
jgi:hypothetical protein